MIIKHVWVLILVGWGMHATHAQLLKPKPETNPNRTKIIAVPLFFYTPDTKLGGGAGGLLTFNFPNDSLRARRSSVTFAASYTQLDQILLYFPYQLFLKREQIWLYGEMSYYRYIYNFFGIGNSFPNDFIEKYDATLPRVRLSALYRVRRGTYAGVRYVYDNFDITPRSTEGFIGEGRVLGAKGGVVSGAGLLFNRDTRDNIFFPSRGWLIESQAYNNSRVTGSDFRYSIFSVDAAHYRLLPRNIVWAINGYAAFATGDVPFHQLPSLGGPRRLRGYFDRKFVDKNLLLLQTELRIPLFWRVGLAAFGGAGTVADRVEHFSTRFVRFNYGAGLRFTVDKQQHINVRFDYALGRQSSGFYMTVGEAF